MKTSIKSIFTLALLAASNLFATPLKIDIEKSPDANLFPAGKPITFNAAIRSIGSASGEVTTVITDYWGETKTIKQPFESKAGTPANFTIDLGLLDLGYYELKTTLSAKDDKGKEITANSDVVVNRIEKIGEKKEAKIQQIDPISFGVAKFVDRTSEQARKDGSRFGLKTFLIGEPGVWWRKDITYDLNKIVATTAKLGLQWTRHQFNQGPSSQPGMISTDDLIKKHPMNVVLKVEGFPEHCWDQARYGDRAKWIAEHKGKAWNRCTVPLKAPYQQWMREELAKLPPEQNIFEIGNEVWSYMSGAEFAEWCQMCVEVIKEVRPTAKIGADPGYGIGKFSDPFFAKGGMNGMDIIYSHPYCFTPLPEHRVRMLLRNLRDNVREATGRDLEIWVTEYGWPTAEKDTRKHSVSETVQAQRTTRQSIMMYAEDVKALIPHWMADREFDIAERENWFGFFRLSGQPKPVLIAHANCARMIDGSKFVGDLWFGPGLAGMLFERNGQYTLCSWTIEGGEKEAELDLGVPEITLVDLMGREKIEKTSGGKIKRKFDTNVTYFVGVSPALARQAVPITAELNPDLWSTRVGSDSMKRASAVQIDGKLDEWSTHSSFNLKGNSALGEASAKMAWDAHHVYVAVTIVDADKSKPGTFKVNLGTKPGRQESSLKLYDSVLALTPSANGPAELSLHANIRGDKPTVLQMENSHGFKWAVQPTDVGWTGEIAIPIKAIRGFPEAKAGSKISFRLSFEKGKAVLAHGSEAARTWPYLTLED